MHTDTCTHTHTDMLAGTLTDMPMHDTHRNTHADTGTPAILSTRQRIQGSAAAAELSGLSVPLPGWGAQGEGRRCWVRKEGSLGTAVNVT